MRVLQQQKNLFFQRAYLHKLRARHEERYGRNRVTIPCEPIHPLLAPPSGRYLDLMNSS